MSRTQKWLLAATLFGVCFLIYLLKPILAPFLIASLLAYLGDPLANRLQRWKIPRTLAVVMVFVVMILIILLLLLLLVPLIQKQISLLIERIPVVINWLQNTAIPWVNNSLGVTVTLDLNTVKTAITQNWQQATGVAQTTIKTLTDSGLALITFVIDLILIPVVTFYLMRDWAVVTAEIITLIPRRALPLLSQLAHDCNQVVGAFFRGQLSVMLILGVYYTLGLWIVGLDFALLIGIMIAFFSIVPFLGTIVGLIIATIATYVQFHDWKHLLFTFIVFTIGHVAENMVLTPWLIGDRIGLHPVAVIFAVLAGGQLFGFVGVLIALTVAAVIMVLLRYLRMHYLQSGMYNQANYDTISDIEL
jgi:predicted PurR-regulated permease PerM